MIRGLYSSATGMITMSKKLDVIGNNISNSETPGFKKESMSISDFDRELTYRLQQSQLVGDLSYGVAPRTTNVDITQGPVTQTGLPTDLAIEGNGFFAVEGGNGVRYTRNGNFTVNDAGYLTLPTGEILQGQNGPVRVDGDHFQVEADGTVLSGGRAVNKIVLYTSQAGATKATDGFFDLTGAVAAGGAVYQGALESANVDAVDEMTALMEASRSFQSCQQAFKVSDQALSQAISQVGSLK